MQSRTTFDYRKTEAVSNRGMAAAMHPLAAEAGAEILERGGNAIDAAVAVGFAIGVVEPYNSGLGGIAVLVYHDAESGQSIAIDGTAPLPRKIHPGVFELLDDDERTGVYQWRAVKDDANNTGHLSVAIPGMPACLCEAHARFGRLPLGEVMAPAIRLAADGFDIDWSVAYTIAIHSARLKRFPGTRETLFNSSGDPYAPSSFMNAADRVVQSWLAETLRRIAANGKDGFYRGETARLIADDMRANGGLLDEEDLAAYDARVFEQPLQGTYGEYQLVASPETNGAPTTFEMLNIVEGYRPFEYGHNSVEALHLIIEAQRRAFVDRFAYLGDPDFAPSPTAGVVSKEFAADRRQTIDIHRATPDVLPGDPWKYQQKPEQPLLTKSGVAGGEGNTTHFTVVDDKRNMVSCVSTLGYYFGSGIVTPGAGMVLNNGVMWFDPEEGSMVSVGPGKRIMTAGTPVIALRRGKPFLTVGAPGGRRVISGIFQVLLNTLEYGMGPAEAIGAPRVHSEGKKVEVDSRLPERVIQGLADRGHDLIVREETPAQSSFSRPNGILVDPDTGVLRGGVTPFGPATAVGI
ncbi:MAG: gamma-glutamyltransferase [Thermomicrobiales bacterium]|nr:gamma-glutamyltransferase [Thermomicrobiales bacterium]